MGYKILGMVVWNGTKWYLRRKVDAGTRQKLAMVAAPAGLLLGAIVARQATSDDS